jgi:membrane-bound lytic murein transglycosylase A
MPPAEGPTGALGAPLTAGYSMAVDPRHIPLGAPVFLDTTRPLSKQPLQRLMLAQDTGGAIRGAVRADFFWGTGDEAGALAGRMRQRGAMWLLWPRGEQPPAR